MSYRVWNHSSSASRFWVTVVLATMLASAPSCTKSRTAQQTFSSPEAAGAALLIAARSGGENALIAVFGPGSKQVLLTDNDSTNKTQLQAFVNAYSQMHRWSTLKAGGKILQVGADNY